MAARLAASQLRLDNSTEDEAVATPIAMDTVLADAANWYRAIASIHPPWQLAWNRGLGSVCGLSQLEGKICQLAM